MELLASEFSQLAAGIDLTGKGLIVPAGYACTEDRALAAEYVAAGYSTKWEYLADQESGKHYVILVDFVHHQPPNRSMAMPTTTTLTATETSQAIAPCIDPEPEAEPHTPPASSAVPAQANHVHDCSAPRNEPWPWKVFTAGPKYPIE